MKNVISLRKQNLTTWGKIAAKVVGISFNGRGVAQFAESPTGDNTKAWPNPPKEGMVARCTRKGIQIWPAKKL